jgi:hypothetical protein
MSDFAKLNARHVFSSAFVIDYMRASIAARPLTSVCMTVNSAEILRSCAAYRTFSVLLHLLLTNEVIVLGIPASTCTWGGFPNTSITYRHAAALSTLTCVVIPANCWGGEVA